MLDERRRRGLIPANKTSRHSYHNCTRCQKCQDHRESLKKRVKVLLNIFFVKISDLLLFFSVLTFKTKLRNQNIRENNNSNNEKKLLRF